MDFSANQEPEQDFSGSIRQDYSQVFETDPNTSAAWTLTGLNAAEFGWEVIS
jgi:hypothetical protein